MTERPEHRVPTADDELEQRLRDVAAQLDPVPEIVLEQARAAFLLRRLDEELAELVVDSAVDEAAALVRGPADDLRMLAFRSERMSVEVEVTRADGRWSLRGLASGATGVVELETAEAAVTVPLDALGRFAVDDVAPGTLRMHLTGSDGTKVTTSWVSL